MRHARPRPAFVVTFALASTALGCAGSKSDAAVGGSGGSDSGSNAGGASSGGTESGPPPPCPDAVPTKGSVCESAGQFCEYATYPCYTGATCSDAGAWAVNVITTGCNPPPPPSDCPAIAPMAGASCTVDATKLCEYPGLCGDGGVGFTAACLQGIWTVSNVDCSGSDGGGDGGNDGGSDAG